jgi:hypothetical protein
MPLDAPVIRTDRYFAMVSSLAERC